MPRNAARRGHRLRAINRVIDKTDLINRVRDGYCSVRYASKLLGCTDEDIQILAFGEIRQ